MKLFYLNKINVIGIHIRIQFYIIIVWVIARVTVVLGINSTRKAIEIALAEYYFNCFTSAIDPQSTG